MKKLPELRLVIKPYNGFYNQWQWRVEKKAHIKNHEWWQIVLTPGTHLLEGYTRTEEKAIEKGKKRAADHCEYLLQCNERNRSVEEQTTIIKVTCQEEPV